MKLFAKVAATALAASLIVPAVFAQAPTAAPAAPTMGKAPMAKPMMGKKSMKKSTMGKKSMKKATKKSTMGKKSMTMKKPMKKAM